MVSFELEGPPIIHNMIFPGFDGNLHVLSLNVILYCSSIMIYINEESLKVTSKPPNFVDSHH